MGMEWKCWIMRLHWWAHTGTVMSQGSIICRLFHDKDDSASWNSVSCCNCHFVTSYCFPVWSVVFWVVTRQCLSETNSCSLLDCCTCSSEWIPRSGGTYCIHHRVQTISQVTTKQKQHTTQKTVFFIIKTVWLGVAVFSYILYPRRLV
jgi:hypothetical protein